MSFTRYLWRSLLKRRQFDQLLEVEPTLRGLSLPYEQLILEDRLGRAGYVTRPRRRELNYLILAAGITSTFVAVLLGWYLERALLTVALAAYGGLLGFTMFLRTRSLRLESALLYELPLLLESLILLVESGLSLLSALEQLFDTPTKSEGREYLRLVIQSARTECEAGVEFSAALRHLAAAIPFPSARHVLFHLDLGTREGGSSARSLRALADYTHAEWQLSISTRVRRLETLIVFPVFTAVIGLLMLIGSGPLLTLLDSDSPMFAQPERSPHEQ